MMELRTFRRRPTAVQAVRLDGSERCAREVAAWSGGEYSTLPVFDNSAALQCVVIHTREGDMLALPGDWVVRGVVGEFYPVKPNVFVINYEPVN